MSHLVNYLLKTTSMYKRNLYQCVCVCVCPSVYVCMPDLLVMPYEIKLIYKHTHLVIFLNHLLP